jgi:hypothetical protein
MADGLSLGIDDLVSVGPNVICVGDLLGIDESGWTLRLRHFVVGEPGVLITYIENFSECSPGDRYIRFCHASRLSLAG